MSDTEKPAAENIISFRPPTLQHPGPEESEPVVIANLTAFCERLDEGMKLIAEVMAGFERRLHKLEFAAAKAERDKPKPVIYDVRGGRAN